MHIRDILLRANFCEIELFTYCQNASSSELSAMEKKVKLMYYPKRKEGTYVKAPYSFTKVKPFKVL